MSTPTEGYYFANVWDNYGRAARNLVRFVNGEPQDERGKRLELASISDVRPATTKELCALWPYASELELDTLRTANKALVERVKRLEHYVERLHSAGNELRDGSGDDDAIYRWRAVKRDNPLHQEHKP